MPVHFKKSVLALLLALFMGWCAWLSYQNQAAPDVNFTSLSGEKIAMTNLKGKVVLVHFWSINCLSCLKEMPALIDFYHRHHRQGFELIAVAMAYDPPALVLNYAKQKKVPFPVMHDGYGQMGEAFGQVSVTPSHFVYGKQGQRLQSTIGALDLNALAKLLSSELAKPD
jgi:thiol-disulfide isomerase/thioredoxin